MYRQHHNTTGSAGVGMGLLGAAAGAAITYFLYGTEKGAEKREKIKEMAYTAKEKIVESSDEITGAAKEFYSTVKMDLKDKYDDLKNIDKVEFVALKERMKLHWEEMKEDIEETIERAKTKPM
jgi:gas vesicle protein